MDENIVRMMQSGDFEAAIAQLNEIIAEDLENYEAILGVAISLLENGQLEEGKRALDYFHDNTDPTYESYEALGIYYIRIDDNEKAEMYLNKGLELNPTSGNLLRNLAMVYTMQHRIDEAEQLLQRSIEYDPENYLTQIAVAQFKIRDQKYEEAARLLLNILTANLRLPPDKEDYIKHLLAELKVVEE